jgi:hypothetical protein
MQPIDIYDRKDFEFHLNKILSNYENRRLVFRGQIEDESLIPSIRRGKGSSPSPGCIPWLTANWSICAKRLVSKFKNSIPTDIEEQAVMQHYGYRSFFVDVTSNPKVALWFALHKFESKRSPFHVDRELRSAVFQWSEYTPGSTGFMYFILIPQDESIERYVDLTNIMPSDATRVHRQSAGALSCLPTSLSIDDLVIAKLRIIDNGWFQNSDLDVSTADLFPPPSVDTFYRCLCTVPYYVGPEVEMNNIQLGHPLLGFFPVYAKSAKELSKEYVPLTRILSCAHPALGWNVATGVIRLEDRHFKVAGATKISLSSLMIHHLSEKTMHSDALLRAPWPSHNLLLEFEPEASLVNPSTRALQEVIRGLWVVLGTNSVMVAEIIDTFDDVFLGHECLYSLPDLKLISKQCSCSDHNYNLKILQDLAQLLMQEIVCFDKDDLGYLKIEYRKKNL